MDGPVDWPTRDLVAHRRSTAPIRTALVDADDGRRYTYRELDREVDRWASALQTTIEERGSSSGIYSPSNGNEARGSSNESQADGSRSEWRQTTSGDRDVTHRVATLVDTRPEFVALFFAVMRIGGTLVPLNVRETHVELQDKLHRTEPTLLVCETETESLALESWEGMIRSIDEPTERGIERLRPASSSTDEGLTAGTLDRTDTQLVMFTSGTSGEPKAVRLTVGNLVASATASAFRLGVTPEDRWLCCLPVYHMGGLAPVVRSAVYETTVVLQRSFEPSATARILEEYDVTGISLVPTMLQRLLDSGWTPPGSLRFVLLGGASASRELLERCFDADVPVHPTYGMTEAASQIATATPEEARSYEGTVGRPLGFTDVAVVDEDGSPLNPGEVGELVISGPTVTPGYLDDGHTENAFCDAPTGHSGRGLRTGDVGYRDSGGRLWVVNRKTDRIVTGGENVDPGEVADVLEAHPEIHAAAVVGLPDEEWGERVAALFVPTRPGEPPSHASIRAHCEGRLASFKRPKTVAHADSLPRTPSDTVDREAVRKRLGSADDER